jgi:hypothetical protein
MLKLGAGYYAVMDRATSLGQLVARNERPLSQPGRFSALPWMTAEGHIWPIAATCANGEAAPIAVIRPSLAHRQRPTPGDPSCKQKTTAYVN